MEKGEIIDPGVFWKVWLKILKRTALSAGFLNKPL
jgi:hypothetical protein